MKKKAVIEVENLQMDYRDGVRLVSVKYLVSLTGKSRRTVVKWVYEFEKLVKDGFYQEGSVITVENGKGVDYYVWILPFMHFLQNRNRILKGYDAQDFKIFRNNFRVCANEY